MEISSALRLNLSLLFMLGSIAITNAQNVEFVKGNFADRKSFEIAMQDIGDGNYYFSLADYQYALHYYEKANKFNPDNAWLNLQIGLCYMNLFPRAKALVFMEKAHKLLPADRSILMHLADGYRLNHEFDKAAGYYKILLDKATEEERKAIERKLRDSEYARERIANPEPVLIDNPGPAINSPYPDYSPIITADESVLIFTSRRSNTTGGGTDAQSPGFFEDIYFSYNIDGQWTEAYNPGKPINSGWHDAVVGITNDGQVLLTYKGIGGGGLYESTLSGTSWSKPKKLPWPINSKFHEPSASYSYDNRTLYFVSNRPGGYGGSDIYVTRFDENTGWSDIENLGPIINTPDDEDAVFMHPDGKTLYFSSKGHQGMGGYDIFRSVLTNGVWSTPENLGYPINTANDDVFFSVTADNRHAYFSSIREGGMGGQDIYRITFLGTDKKLISAGEDQWVAIHAESTAETHLESAMEIKSSMMILLKGIVSDETTLTPLSARIELIDNSKNEIIAVFESNRQTGRFLVSLPAGKNYGIAIRTDGYLFHSENFDIPDLREFKVVEKNIRMKKVEKGKEIVLKNVFFDYNQFRLKQESLSELDRVVSLMQEYPTLIIEISGHTDNIGNAAYNKELSLQRARSVVDYLVSKGIAASRLQSVGFGFEKPVADNQTEEGRRLNRRSEFRIVER